MFARTGAERDNVAMRAVLAITTLSVASVALVVACVGGPGSADQGGDNGDQYGNIGRDTTGGSITTGSNGSVSSSGSTSSSTSTSSGAASSSSSSSGSSTSGSSSGVTYPPQADMRASDYDQTCQSSSDCVAVQEGTVCTVCGCQNAAVNTKDVVKFATERSSRLSKCDPAIYTQGVACAACQAKTAYCDSFTKRCVYGTPPADAGF